MAAVRYYLALVIVMMVPGTFVFWYSIHPFVRFWRRVGTVVTYAVHFTMITVVAVILFRERDVILAVDFGTNWFLVALSVPVYVLAVRVARGRTRALRMKVLLGFPELAPEKYESKLLTAGIYGRMRHPRYVEMMLSLLAHALLVNYLATYAIVVISGLGLWLVIVLEEKELRTRFGEDYKRYCEQVSRFVPRFRV